MKSNYFTLTDDAVCTLTLTRPDAHNAFDGQMIRELTLALEQVIQAKARVLILKSTGDSFSAGADLNWMRAATTFSHMENYDDAKALATLMETLNTLPCITVAAVQGAAYGGGVGLVACCDIALSVASAQFALTEVSLGLVPAVISPYVLRAMGPRQARRYFTSAERFDAHCAQELNLIHDVFATQQDLDAALDKLIQRLLKMAPQAQIMAKKMVLNLQERPVIDSYVIEDTVQWIMNCRTGEEGKEGITAFLEKRTPHWAA